MAETQTVVRADAGEESKPPSPKEAGTRVPVKVMNLDATVVHRQVFYATVFLLILWAVLMLVAGVFTDLI